MVNQGQLSVAAFCGWFKVEMWTFHVDHSVTLPSAPCLAPLTSCDRPHPSHTSPWRDITQPIDALSMWAWTVACPCNVWHQSAARCTMMILSELERGCADSPWQAWQLYIFLLKCDYVLVEDGSRIIFESLTGVSFWLGVVWGQTADLWIKCERFEYIVVKRDLNPSHYQYHYYYC